MYSGSIGVAHGTWCGEWDSNSTSVERQLIQNSIFKKCHTGFCQGFGNSQGRSLDLEGKSGQGRRKRQVL